MVFISRLELRWAIGNVYIASLETVFMMFARRRVVALAGLVVLGAAEPRVSRAAWFSRRRNREH